MCAFLSSSWRTGEAQFDSFSKDANIFQRYRHAPEGSFLNMGKKKKRHAGRFTLFTSCLSTTMVLILLGTMVFFIAVAENISRHLREEMPVAILLSDSISQHEQGKLQYELRNLPGVQKVTYVSKEQGALETMQAMGIEKEEFLEHNPIGAEFELRLCAEYTNKDSIALIESYLKDRSGVIEVVSPMAEIDLLNSIIPIVSLVFLSVAVLLAFISTALINNTIRMSVYARRFTIHTMKMVGAKWSFIRRPFMNQAFCIGLISALLANLLIAAGVYQLFQLDVYIARLISPMVLIITLGSVLLAGITLTWICAYISVNRFLRMSTDQIFMK